MGDVFLARDEALGRRIALKRIRLDRAGEADIRRRFEIEARVTSVLQHPAIVPVYQLVREGEEIFYTMRPVEGMTFGDLLWRLRDVDSRAREEWPPARLVRLFLQAAHAVAYAHSRGVIHRDLKPSNIMIGPFEEVVVLDWGMAKVLDAAGDEWRGEGAEAPPPLAADSSPRSVVGTPAYMAPQQLLGAPADVASDIFSLGVTLYELLTLRLPWEAADLEGLYRARSRAPRMPTRFEPATAIPHDLALAVLRALEFEPGKRFPSVTGFAKEVADALEGRATWQVEEKALARGKWSFTGGRLDEDGGELTLRSGGLLRYFCVERFGENVRLSFDFNVPRGNHDLSVWLHAAEPRASAEGYRLVVLAGNRQSVSLLRSGRVVAGGHAPRCEQGRWHSVTATREDDRFQLSVDGEEVYVHHDPIPLRGGFVGITAQSSALRIRNLTVLSRGTSATVSCLAVPDAFFNRRLYAEARAEYEAIAQSQSGRNEGRLAGFRAGLCLLEMAREEDGDGEFRAFLIDEASEVFLRLKGANRSCFEGLGLAMAAVARADPEGEIAGLTRAFSDHPGDPHLAAVREWLLGRLHSAGRHDRRLTAALLPLAISNCMDGWGRSVARDLMKVVHHEWEIPSFVTSRGRFRANDPASHAEAKMLLGFWTARPESIEDALDELAATGRFRPHHVADAVLCLIELGDAPRAGSLLARLAAAPGAAGNPALERVLSLLRSSVLAAGGEHSDAERLFASVSPDPFDRIYNSVRLVKAHACFDGGKASRAFQLLKPLGPEERFAREHQAWFHLKQGDTRGASRQLEILVKRGDHRAGRNLCNFLYGALLIMKGREDAAREVFAALPLARWPRTWTLGSHYALGRLGDGRLESYVQHAFPYERKCLKRHAELLARARGETPDALPPVLRG
jgi:serine/threonine-protein kinase